MSRGADNSGHVQHPVRLGQSPYFGRQIAAPELQLLLLHPAKRLELLHKIQRHNTLDTPPPFNVWSDMSPRLSTEIF